MQRAATLYQQWFTTAADAGGPQPRDRILAIFDALVEQVHPGRCRGCPFLMALSEVPDVNTPAHQHAVELKAWVRDQLRLLTHQLATPETLPEPDTLAVDLALVMEGVYASAETLDATGTGHRARAIAATLIDAASAG